VLTHTLPTNAVCQCDGHFHPHYGLAGLVRFKTAEQKGTLDFSPAIFWISHQHAQTQTRHPSQHLAHKDNKYMITTTADN